MKQADTLWLQTLHSSSSMVGYKPWCHRGTNTSMSVVTMWRLDVYHLLLTTCYVQNKDKIKFSAPVLVTLSSENSLQQPRKVKCLKHDIYFGNTANNALNIYGTDACFKVCMNHCVKSISCKKGMVCALAAETPPSQHMKWSCKYINWGLGQELSPHHKRPVCYKMLYKALDFDNLGKR